MGGKLRVHTGFSVGRENADKTNRTVREDEYKLKLTEIDRTGKYIHKHGLKFMPKTKLIDRISISVPGKEFTRKLTAILFFQW